MSALCRMLSIYIRNGEAFVVPRGGSPGFSWEVGPVLRGPATLDSLSELLSKAIAVAPMEGTSPKPDWSKASGTNDPVLEKSGFASRPAFERGAKYFNVDVSGERITLTRWRPDPERGEGYTDDPWEVVLPADASMKLIAGRIIDALPTTLARPSRPSSKGPAVGLTAEAVPLIVATYAPDFGSADQVAEVVHKSSRGLHDLMINVLEYIKELLAGDPDAFERDTQEQLKRVMGLIEFLLRDGSPEVRDAVRQSLIETDVLRKPVVRKFAGGKTKMAFRSYMTA